MNNNHYSYFCFYETNWLLCDSSCMYVPYSRVKQTCKEEIIKGWWYCSKHRIVETTINKLFTQEHIDMHGGISLISIYEVKCIDWSIYATQKLH